jgi:hypothetical protein
MSHAPNSTASSQLYRATAARAITSQIAHSAPGPSAASSGCSAGDSTSGGATAAAPVAGSAARSAAARLSLQSSRGVSSASMPNRTRTCEKAEGAARRMGVRPAGPRSVVGAPSARRACRQQLLHNGAGTGRPLTSQVAPTTPSASARRRGASAAAAPPGLPPPGRPRDVSGSRRASLISLQRRGLLRRAAHGTRLCWLWGGWLVDMGSGPEGYYRPLASPSAPYQWRALPTQRVPKPARRQGGGAGIRVQPLKILPPRGVAILHRQEGGKNRHNGAVGQQARGLGARCCSCPGSTADSLLFSRANAGRAPGGARWCGGASNRVCCGRSGQCGGRAPRRGARPRSWRCGRCVSAADWGAACNCKKVATCDRISAYTHVYEYKWGHMKWGRRPLKE